MIRKKWRRRLAEWIYRDPRPLLVESDKAAIAAQLAKTDQLVCELHAEICAQSQIIRELRISLRLKTRQLALMEMVSVRARDKELNGN